MDPINSSQKPHPLDHAIVQTLEHSVHDETSTATDQGTRGATWTAPDGDDNDKEKENESGGHGAGESSPWATDICERMPMSHLLDDDAENMPSGSYESWITPSSAFSNLQIPSTSSGPEAADGDAGLVSRGTDADEKLRAVLRAIRRPGRPRGLTVAVDEEAVDACSTAEAEWEDVQVLDCSDEVWEQILGTGDAFSIWEDGQTVEGGGEGDMKS
ncbi:hypothetical protein E4U43_002678 [Claviceps pusilla]|uniref:Uncharacterized protein n=1 Tax=Claviceps pusilla TaxID=123648 RepID=A0A9P7N8I9_9HYPO|nr:hypothetical protein E4U43_002678 [Claviceps pusilla]